MSQQKMLFAACLVAGLVALVAGQSIDPMQCTQQAQNQFNQYTQTVSQMMRQLMKDLSKQGQSALNIDGMTQDADQLIQQISSMSDTSNGLDMQRIMETYYKIVQTQMKMAQQMMNPRAGLGMMQTYINFTTKLMSTNSEFLMSLSSQCMPARRISSSS